MFEIMGHAAITATEMIGHVRAGHGPTKARAVN